jgi:hypothetical protein
VLPDRGGHQVRPGDTLDPAGVVEHVGTHGLELPNRRNTSAGSSRSVAVTSGSCMIVPAVSTREWLRAEVLDDPGVSLRVDRHVLQVGVDHDDSSIGPKPLRTDSGKGSGKNYSCLFGRVAAGSDAALIT